MENRTSYERARDVAAEAAVQAGKIISRYAGQIAPEDIRSKGLHDLVTQADEEAQRVAIEVLRSAYPDYQILAEEGAELSDLKAGVDGFRWIIDPIDGTTNFTRGLAPYSVSIALQHEEEIVAGVVLDVPHRELFSAVKGGGLYVNGIRSGVSRIAHLHDAFITTGFPYRVLDHLEPYLHVLGEFMSRTNGVRRPGSAAVDMAHVAVGRFDGFFEDGLQPWDVAAGLLLIQEGGGHVTDYSGEPHPVFRQQIVASNGLIHEDMLDVIRPLRDYALAKKAAAASS